MSSVATRSLGARWDFDAALGSGSVGTMRTVIEAIIFDGGPRTAAVPQGMRTVQLQAALTMHPSPANRSHRVNPAGVGDEPIPSGWILKQPVAALARALSADRRVLDIFGETADGREPKKRSHGTAAGSIKRAVGG